MGRKPAEKKDKKKKHTRPYKKRVKRIVSSKTHLLQWMKTSNVRHTIKQGRNLVEKLKQVPLPKKDAKEKAPKLQICPLARLRRPLPKQNNFFVFAKENKKCSFVGKIASRENASCGKPFSLFFYSKLF